MSISTEVILPLLSAVGRQLDGDVSLQALAVIAKRSPFDLHRAFRRVTGETPKRFTSRLRLERAAAQLILDRRPIVDLALDHGFASHEVFTRAFLRRFGMTPRSYRARGQVRGQAREMRAIAAKHAAVVRTVGPCVRLYHLAPIERTSEMSITVSRKEFAPRPALVIRRKIASSEIAATLGEVLGRIFEYAQRNAIPLAGQPYVRYLSGGRGLLTIEAGLPIAATAVGEGDIEITELTGGPAAVAIHVGAYDQLPQTHAAIERWIDANRLEAGSAPWEMYITDPGETPDPAQWQTEVVYPLRPLRS